MNRESYGREKSLNEEHESQKTSCDSDNFLVFVGRNPVTIEESVE